MVVCVFVASIDTEDTEDTAMNEWTRSCWIMMFPSQAKSEAVRPLPERRVGPQMPKGCACGKVVLQDSEDALAVGSPFVELHVHVQCRAARARDDVGL